MRQKTTYTRQWLNADKSSTAAIATVVDDHSASVSISDCNRTIELHSYSLDEPRGVTAYIKKMKTIINALESHITEIESRWQ